MLVAAGRPLFNKPKGCERIITHCFIEYLFYKAMALWSKQSVSVLFFGKLDSGQSLMVHNGKQWNFMVPVNEHNSPVTFNFNKRRYYYSCRIRGRDCRHFQTFCLPGLKLKIQHAVLTVNLDLYFTAFPQIVGECLERPASMPAGLRLKREMVSNQARRFNSLSSFFGL